MTRETPGKPASQRRVKTIGWLVIVLAPVAFFAALEGAARLFDRGPSRRAEIPPWLDPGILEKEKTWIDLLAGSPGELASYYATYRWDRDLFYRLQPNLSFALTDVAAPDAVRPRTRWTFRTNALGFNAREVPQRKPHGSFRIVALGDSSTFGWGVESEEAYPHQLEGILRARNPGARIEVVNLGVCGYSSFQGLLLLRDDGLRYEPDVVTLSFGSNDYSMVPEPFDQVHERSRRWTGAVRALLHRSRAYQVYASWLASTAVRSGGREDGGVLNVGPDKSFSNLAEMARTARGAGADPLFVENCTPGDMAAPMRRAAQEEDVPLVPTGDILSTAAPSPSEMARVRSVYGEALVREFPWLALYLGDHCHPNPAGQRILAEAVASAVEATPAFRRFLSGEKG